MARNINLPILATGIIDLKSISERDFQRALWAYAEDRGWKCHYMYKSAQRLQNGKYRGLGTPGWPDVIAVRGESMLAIECKAERGRATAEQKKWLDTLKNVPGVETFIWKPRDAAEVIERLK